MMQRAIWLTLTFVLCSLAVSVCAAAEETLSYADLVHRMTNLERLATLPAPGEKCGLCSSYDRSSKYDGQSGKYVNWGANGDGNGVVRREGRQVVMAEMEGPGCIWRIWSADAKKGHVRIYLDGQETPAVDLPFRDYFTGRVAPFNYPMLSYNLNKMGCSGQNLYFPIPYQKSCKVVADEGWGAYYHFTYATFPKETKVPTFSAALAEQNAEALKQVNDFFLNKLGDDPAGHRDGEKTAAKLVQVAAGKTVQVCEFAGPEAITAIRVKMMLRDRDDQMAVLRNLAIRITWDDQAKPAVWCPLGDFFGTAPGENYYQSLVSGMTKDCYYAYWFMPFAKKAVVELTNDGRDVREVQFEIVHAPLGRKFEGLGYFHCKWHRDSVELPADRFPDWVMLKTEGCGRFCGVMLHVWNPWPGWWGEGDEKFFVDGEKFPSTFGTGSEDYFGYAWCNPGLFQRPYHGQSMSENNEGHQSVFRWHILDNVPFQTSFEGCIEKYFDEKERGTTYACVPFWYLSPDGVDSYDLPPAKDRQGYYVKPPRKVAGFTILNVMGGDISSQTLGDKWPNKTQLLWNAVAQRAKLDIALNVPKAGKYRVIAVMTKAADYGIVQCSIDGRAIGQRLDLYHDGVIPTNPPIELGTMDLPSGQRTFSVEVVGQNDKSTGMYFGLDRLELKPVKK